MKKIIAVVLSAFTLLFVAGRVSTDAGAESRTQQERLLFSKYEVMQHELIETNVKATENKVKAEFIIECPQTLKKVIYARFGLDENGFLEIEEEKNPDFFASAAYDKYRVLVDKTDVFQKEVGNWGFQIEEIEEGLIALEVIIPKRIVLGKFQ